MTDPIFVKPRHQYDSYVDYWKLVALAGYPTVFEDQIDPRSDNTYILTMLNLDAIADGGGWPEARARLIYWDLEWHDKSFAGRIPGLNEFWTPDRSYAQRQGYQHVPLGSHPMLVTVNPTLRWQLPEWDVCLLAYMGPWRRQEVLSGLQVRGITIAPASAWGAARDRQLGASRCMVHVHQHDDFPTIAAQRFALAACAALPLVSETIADPFPLVPGRDYLEADRLDIPAAVGSLLRNRQGRDLAANLWETLCQTYRFEKNVQQALARQNEVENTVLRRVISDTVATVHRGAL